MSRDGNLTTRPANDKVDETFVEGQDGRPEAINRLVEVTARRNLMALNAAMEALPEVSGRTSLEAALDMHGIAQRLLNATEDFMQTLPSKASVKH